MRPTAPDPTQLPTARTLSRAATAVLVFAALLAVGVVLPAETGRDPTGLGSMLGLAEMGKIKVALAAEALAADSATAGGVTVGIAATTSTRASADSAWRDSIAITLEPNKGIEFKLTMRQGERAQYAWSSDGGDVYFNRHGEPPNAPKDVAAHSYEKGMAPEDRGEIEAVFDGVHGWFWRNRNAAPITITLKTRGQYRQLQQM